MVHLRKISTPEVSTVGPTPSEIQGQILWFFACKDPKSPFTALLNIKCQIIGISSQIECKKG